MSLARTIRNFRRAGFKEWFRQMTYIGDAKFGKHVGTDVMGNRYYENMNPAEEVPGRQRWIDYAQDDFNASQAVPEWHSWLHGIRKDPPPEDPIMNKSRAPWQTEPLENLTGTRAAYRPYPTVAPKVRAWEPVARARGAGAEAVKPGVENQ